jgi:hypothetical protein
MIRARGSVDVLAATPADRLPPGAWAAGAPRTAAELVVGPMPSSPVTHSVRVMSE